MLDVQLENADADTSKFVNNGEWDLISIKGHRNEIKYPCCPNTPYADLTYTIRIRRRTRFYYINLIIPCFVITGTRYFISTTCDYDDFSDGNNIGGSEF